MSRAPRVVPPYHTCKPNLRTPPVTFQHTERETKLKGLKRIYRSILLNVTIFYTLSLYLLYYYYYYYIFLFGCLIYCGPKPVFYSSLLFRPPLLITR